MAVQGGHVLRSNTIYLLGHEYGQILGSKLPSNKQVLCVFFYNHRSVKLSIRESARLTIKEASVFWSKAQIPTREEHHCIAKLEKLYNKWQNLQRSSKKKSDFQIQKEKDFIEQLPDLFDIAHANALEIMKNDIDRKFLISQRQKGRPGSLIGIDLTEIKKYKRKSERTEREVNFKRKHLETNNYAKEEGELESTFFFKFFHFTSTSY